MADDIEANYLPQSGRIKATSGKAVIPSNLNATTRANEWQLKLILLTAFLPQGLSLFIGDFRLPLVRLLLIVMLVPAIRRFLARVNASTGAVLLPDIIAICAGAWMLIAGIATDGLANGLKGGGALVIEFVGSYFIFRSFLEGKDSSIRIIYFASWIMIFVAALALLDPLMGRVFTQEIVAQITGHALNFSTTSGGVIRNGLVRAMGPMENSILFGAACSWFVVLILGCFGLTRYTLFFCGMGALGCWFTQSRASFAVLLIGVAFLAYNRIARGFQWRWHLVVLGVISYIAVVFGFSRNPVSTLLTAGGLDPEAGWYRELIWAAAGPLVLGSPVFGLGLGDDNWDWRLYEGLVGSSVDALWLRSAMLFGIPGSFLIFLTIVSPYFAGPLDGAAALTKRERNLSAALLIVTGLVVLLGFAVHFWGTTWILLGIFPAIRAHLTEASLMRPKAARRRGARDAQGSRVVPR